MRLPARSGVAPTDTRATCRSTGVRAFVIAASVALLLASTADARSRVTVSGGAHLQGTLTAKATGGTIQAVTWERCSVKRAICPTGKGGRVGTGTTYGPQPEDIDAFLRAVVKVKARGGATRTIRSAWKGPVRLAPTPAGAAKGMQPGEYECFMGAAGYSRLWVDSASVYRDPDGKAGTYALEGPGATVYTKDAVKINWTSGTYAEWQRETPPFWAEYIPVGTISPATGQPITKPAIIFTFQPGSNLDWAASGWTTCNPK